MITFLQSNILFMHKAVYFMQTIDFSCILVLFVQIPAFHFSFKSQSIAFTCFTPLWLPVS